MYVCSYLETRVCRGGMLLTNEKRYILDNERESISFMAKQKLKRCVIDV